MQRDFNERLISVPGLLMTLLKQIKKVTLHNNMGIKMNWMLIDMLH